MFNSGERLSKKQVVNTSDGDALQFILDFLALVGKQVALRGSLELSEHQLGTCFQQQLIVGSSCYLSNANEPTCPSSSFFVL